MVKRGEKQASGAAEDRLYVIAVRIEHEGGIVARRITFGGVAKPRWAIIGPVRLQGGRVKGVDLATVPGHEGCMLLHAMWVEAVDPEDRVIDTLADAIGPIVRGKLLDPTEAERTQSPIVKGGRMFNVRDSNAGVVGHCGVLRPSKICWAFPHLPIQQDGVHYRPFRPNADAEG
jgi:hypothetical protein